MFQQYANIRTACHRGSPVSSASSYVLPPLLAFSERPAMTRPGEWRSTMSALPVKVKEGDPHGGRCNSLSIQTSHR